MFPLSLFPEDWRWVLWANPMTAFVIGYQNLLLQGVMPTAGVWIAIALWIAGLTLLLNVLVRRSREQLVDWL